MVPLPWPDPPAGKVSQGALLVANQERLGDEVVTWSDPEPDTAEKLAVDGLRVSVPNPD